MIISIQHKGLKLLWTKNDTSKLRPDHVKKLKAILDVLDGAMKIEDINFPGSNLHLLKGELKGFWAVSVNGNYRLIFEFRDGDAYLIDYLDYH
jgi:proteic killer suppression protein